MVGLILDSTSDKLRSGVHAGFCHQSLLILLLGSVLQCFHMQGDLSGQGQCGLPEKSSLSVTRTEQHQPHLVPGASTSLPGSSSFLSPPVRSGLPGPDKPSVAHMTVYALHTDRVFHLK